MEKIPVEKNKEYIVEIIDNGFEGEGIAKIDNFTIFIPGTIKGEKVRVLIVKVLSSHFIFNFKFIISFYLKFSCFVHHFSFLCQALNYHFICGSLIC